MIRAALYARYSSDRQNERSIADQVAVLIRHAAAKGWAVVGVYEDAALSGSAMANRPGLLNALAAAERGEFDVLLAEDQDRVARNLEHEAHVFNRLQDLGVRLATLATDQVQILDVAFKGLMNELYLANLSQKTKRGMASNAEKGLATGSRLFGYRSEPGGAMTIVEAEAEVVRRIFRLYVEDQLTAREIAARLNQEGVRAARGGAWSASTISGSRSRANGVLHTELYAGVKVFGRVEMRKDRRTGRRVTVCRPAGEHRRVEVPHLRIVDQALWDAAQARKLARAVTDPAQRAKLVRRPHVLSGLLRCARCGSAYTSLSAGRLVCAGYREKGPSVCDNRRHVGRAEVEQRVLGGLQARLLAPEAVAAYVRAYHAAWERRTAQARDNRRPIERRLGEVERAIARGVDAILSGAATAAALGKKLEELEAEQAKLQAQLAALDAEPAQPIQLHPRAADGYAERVAQLQARLQQAAAGQLPAERSLVDAVRGLIDHIDIEPVSDERAAPVRITVHGTLSRFLEPAPAQCGGAMVAGGGIEPPTCGL